MYSIEKIEGIYVATMVEDIYLPRKKKEIKDIPKTSQKQ